LRNSTPKISAVIPSRTKSDPLLKDLIRSIKAQDYPKKKIEIIVETRGDSESAKAMGIRRAKGDIIGMFCADNYIVDKNLFKQVSSHWLDGEKAIFPLYYHYRRDDNSLNRYFSLFGGNDPICWWLGKNDRLPHVSTVSRRSDYQPSYGCNGFFYDAKTIKATNLDHYYPMDNFADTGLKYAQPIFSDAIWHRTSDTLFSFLKKRYVYARDLYLNRQDRRWKMLDGIQDYWKLLLFVLATASLVQPLYVSIRGFRVKRDWAWFWHLPVCIGFTITYGAMTIRWLLTRLLSRLSAEQARSETA